MIKQKKKQIVRTCALALGVLAMTGCGGSSGGGSNGGDVTIDGKLSTRPLFFDALGVIPVSDTQATSYVLHLNNISDQAYTLESISVSDAGSKQDSKLVGVSATMCGTLAAKGSCSIQITPQSGGKSADALLSVKMRSSDGEEKIVNQIIRMSNKVGSKGGIYFKNDISELTASDGNYGISVPVLLTKDYEDVKATNGNLSCNGEGFTKGTSCTLTIRGKALDDKTIVATELTAYRSGKIAETISATSMVRTNNQADLLLSHGAEVLADNARIAKTAMISVFNNGGVDAGNITKSLAANSKLKLVGGSNDTCGTSLGAGDVCFFEVAAASDLNGEEAVTVKYDDGASPVVNRSVATNVSYVAQNADIKLEVKSSGGSLENTLLGTKSTQTITVTNNGNRNLEKLSFANAAVAGISMKPAVTNGCGTTLAKTKSCAMEIQYQPTSAQAKKDMLINISAQYLNGAGSAMQHRQLFSTPYSALDAADINLLSMTTEDAADLSILVNGTGDAAKASAAYAIKNTSSTSNGYTAKLTSDPTLNQTITGLAIDNSVADNCKTGSEIAAGASCGFNVNYGPVTVDQAKTEVELSAGYSINGISGVAKSVSANKFNVEAQDQLAIMQTSVSLSGAATTGKGTSDDHYKFTALSDDKVKLTYTFKNAGNTAGNFTVKTSYLPSGVEVLGTSSCAHGIAKPASIAADGTCSLDLSVPKASLFNNPVDTINPAVTVGQFELPLIYSLDGKDYTGIKQYIDFDRNWAKASYAVDSITSTNTRHIVKIKATLNPTKNSYSISIKLRPEQVTMLADAKISECSVSQAGETCMITAEFPRDKYFAGEEILLDFGALASGMNTKDTIYGRVAVTIPDSPVVVTDTQVNAVKPLVVAANGTEITVNNETVTVQPLPAELPLTVTQEKPQITNAFSLGENSNLSLAQTNSNGNQLVIVKPDGSAEPVVLPVPPKDPAKPIVMQILSTTLGGKPLVSGRDPSSGNAQYATIDAQGNLQVLGDPAKPISFMSVGVGTPTSLSDGNLLVSTGGTGYSNPLYVLGLNGYQKLFHEWLNENGYNYEAWKHGTPIKGYITLATDNHIYIMNGGSDVISYLYQLDTAKKSLVQIGDGAISSKGSYEGQVVYVDPAQDLYYAHLSHGDQGRYGGLYMLQGKTSQWLPLAEDTSKARSQSAVFKKTAGSVYPTIYTLGKTTGIYKSNGKEQLQLLAQTKDIKWADLQFQCITDSDGDIYAISSANQLVRLTASEEVKLASVPADQSIQPSGTRISALPDGKVYLKAINTLTKAVTIYLYDKASDLLLKTNYKDLPR